MEPVSLAEQRQFERLYELQDRVLELVFAQENEFYLTGGTCISRFYWPARYSDDLDFFTNQSPRFAFAVRRIINALSQQFELLREVEGREFVRLRVNNSLQIDFVNEPTARQDEPTLTPQRFFIDTIPNILANKLTAIMGRDNPKDIFDLLLIMQQSRIDWPQVLAAAHQKAVFSNEDLAARLKSFPVASLNQIKFADSRYIDCLDPAAQLSQVIAAVLG